MPRTAGKKLIHPRELTVSGQIKSLTKGQRTSAEAKEMLAKVYEKKGESAMKCAYAGSEQAAKSLGLKTITAKVASGPCSAAACEVIAPKSKAKSKAKSEAAKSRFGK